MPHQTPYQVGQKVLAVDPSSNRLVLCTIQSLCGPGPEDEAACLRTHTNLCITSFIEELVPLPKKVTGDQLLMLINVLSTN